MAGAYPDVPSWRMPLDDDGTAIVRYPSVSNVATQLSDADVAILSDESSSVAEGTYRNGWQKYAVVFPELRDLDAYFICATDRNEDGTPSAGALETSTDTTNGLDGTWTTVQTNVAVSALPMTPAYRDAIQSVFATSIRAVRFSLFDSIRLYLRNVHLFGEMSPGSNPDRLDLWRPADDQKIAPAHFDWGDVPRSSVDERQFRVKNLSPSLTANDVIVSFQTATDTSPSVAGQHVLSADGTNYLPQLNIGNLAPGQASQTLTLRRQMSSTAALSLWAGRVVAIPTTMT